MSRSRVLSFTDPFAYQSAFRSVEVELFPTAKGNFYAELTQVSMSKLWIHCAHEDLPRVYVGAVKPHRTAIGFLTKPNQLPMLHCGMAVSPGDIIINDTDMMHRRTAANCDWGSMSLPKDDLDATCQAVTGHEHAGSPSKHLVRPAPDLMARLLNINEMVGQLARISPDVLSLDEVSRALEQTLVLLMIRCMHEGESSRMTTGGLRHDMIIVRFEEFLEAHSDRPLYLTEICAAIGVAERTLRVACDEHLGMGPIRFLSLRRLHLVRRVLGQADPLTTTVTRVATDHGFWELGRFSVAYRMLFGESPSETLRRTSDDQPFHLNRPSSLGNPVLLRRQRPKTPRARAGGAAGSFLLRQEATAGAGSAAQSARKQQNLSVADQPRAVDQFSG
jgi:AraC-like DNA-binding protein